MNKIIKFIITVAVLTIIFFYILDLSGVSFYNSTLFNVFYSEFDYPNVKNDDLSFNLSKFLNSNNIINYEYGTVFYKNMNKKSNIKNSKTKKENDNLSTEDKTISTIKENQKDLIPLVYIYNTHNKEAYAKTGGLSHNITPNVVTVSYMLKEQLEEYKIGTIVEERKASDVLDKNKWNYASSYKVTKEFLGNSKKNNPSLQFFIDVHRDSVKKSISTITFNNKNYAKIMFVLGLENENYKENQIMMEYLDNNIKKEYPGLSRGIYKKKGKGVNGVYNQDFSSNCILIEFGGEENTLEEVYNTTLVVSKYLSLYIGDKIENR